MSLTKLLIYLASLLPVAGIGASNYGQALIHTADGGTYIVTTDDASFVYKVAPSGVNVICVTFNNAIGLPQATNDTIFKSGFEYISLCFKE